MRSPLIESRLSEFESHAAEYDAIASRVPDLDPFCSSSDWILPAHAAFSPGRPVWFHRSSAGFAVFAVSRLPLYGPTLEPLEFLWGLASPIVAHHPEQLVAEFVHLMFRRLAPTRVLLGGIRKGSRLERIVVRGLWKHLRVRRFAVTRVRRASLEGGRDGFLGRRSRKFRVNLRRAHRRLSALGITFEPTSAPRSDGDVQALHARLLGVEARSWKGSARTGLCDPDMARFYLEIMRRTRIHGGLRVLFATRDGQDVGYLFGVVRHDTFRGLQASFDERFAQASLGSALHWEMIGRLCDEGVAWYDMGVEVEYKHRWAEDSVAYSLLLAL